MGPRRFPNLYQGCTAGDFIEAIGRARIRPTGRSRKAGYAPSDPQNPDAIDWRSFELSFDSEHTLRAPIGCALRTLAVDGCPAPHIFDSSEGTCLYDLCGDAHPDGTPACDLLSAFGGVLVRGDSSEAGPATAVTQWRSRTDTLQSCDSFSKD